MVYLYNANQFRLKQSRKWIMKYNILDICTKILYENITFIKKLIIKKGFYSYKTIL